MMHARNRRLKKGHMCTYEHLLLLLNRGLQTYPPVEVIVQARIPRQREKRSKNRLAIPIFSCQSWLSFFLATRVEMESGREPKREKTPIPATQRYEGAAAGRGRKKKGIERASRDENATGKGAGVRGEGVQRNVICFCGFLLENTKRQVEKNVFVLQN